MRVPIAPPQHHLDEAHWATYIDVIPSINPLHLVRRQPAAKWRTLTATGGYQRSPNRTWYDEHGAGDSLVLVHPGGGGVDSRAFAPNLDALASRPRTFTPQRRGHGRTPDVDGPITFEAVAQDTIQFLEQVVGGPARLVGYSDGAIVALLVALRRPELVTRLVFVAGVSTTTAGCPA